MDIYDDIYEPEGKVLTKPLKAVSLILLLSFLAFVIINMTFSIPSSDAVKYNDIDLIPAIKLSESEKKELKAKKADYLEHREYYEREKEREDSAGDDHEKSEESRNMPDGVFLN